MDALLYVVIGLGLFVVLSLLKQRFFGFAAQSPKDYADLDGSFDLPRHLTGPILCEGVIYGPTGRVTSRFVGDFDARWEGNSCVMSEVFTYDNGVVQKREWRLTIGNVGTIRALADDVVGEGTGTQCGPSVQLKYRIRLPESAGGHVLDTIDWMYLAPNGTIVNRSQFRKFGIKVAELVATMRKKETA
jgi:hypothetical protein